MAIAAFVVALVSLPLIVLVIPAIVAIVLAIVARRRIKRNPAKKGRGLTTAALSIAIVTALGGIAIDIGIGVYLSQAVSYEDLEPGDCIKEPGDEFVLLRRQSCSGEHERQVFAVFDSPEPPSAPYPSDEGLRFYAQTECMARFPSTSSPPASELQSTPLVPSESRWEDDQRRIVCLVGRRDGRPLTGQLEGGG